MKGQVAADDALVVGMNSQLGDLLRHDPAGITAPERVDLVMGDGAVIRLRRYAGRRKTRLVMSHGNGMAINAYAPFWKLFAGDYDLVIFDVRNHGENPLHPEGHDWDRFADDFEEIFNGINEQFGPMPTVGVFHSLSSIAAVMQVNKYGRRWAGIVLFDPPIMPPAKHPLHVIEAEHMADMTMRALRRATHYDFPGEMTRQLEARPAFGKWTAGAHALFARSTLRETDGGRWTLACPRELEARIFETNIDEAVWPSLAHIDVPMLLVGADPANPHSSPPARITRAIHEDLGIPYVLVKDTTHFLQIEDPRGCHLAVTEFLNAHGW